MKLVKVALTLVSVAVALIALVYWQYYRSEQLRMSWISQCLDPACPYNSGKLDAIDVPVKRPVVLPLKGQPFTECAGSSCPYTDQDIEWARENLKSLVPATFKARVLLGIKGNKVLTEDGEYTLYGISPCQGLTELYSPASEFARPLVTIHRAPEGAFRVMLYGIIARGEPLATGRMRTLAFHTEDLASMLILSDRALPTVQLLRADKAYAKYLLRNIGIVGTGKSFFDACPADEILALADELAKPPWYPACEAFSIRVYERLAPQKGPAEIVHRGTIRQGEVSKCRTSEFSF